MSAIGRAKLLVFLGNPGLRYARTRHNAGWLLLDTAPFSRADGWQRKFKGAWTRFSLTGESIVLLKPETMMNLSGESVQAAARYFRVSPEEILVIHDEVELAFGLAGLRLGGGLAGHNGLRSIATHLSTREFWRLRIGVDRPRRGDLHGHVLGRFSEEEEAWLPEFLEGCARYVENGLRDGLEAGPARRIIEYV